MTPRSGLAGIVLLPRRKDRAIDTAHGPMRSPHDLEFLFKGIIGTVSPVLGVITSFQEQIEWHLRIASLVVGLAVGVLSLISLIRRLRRR